MKNTPDAFTVIAALKAIQRFYKIGIRSLKKHPARMPYGSWKTEALRFELHPETLSKARLFAAPKRAGYNKRELDQLFALCKRHAYPITVNHIIKFLSVPKSDRLFVQQRAALEHWSPSRLASEIKQSFGARRSGGRPPTPAQDVDHACMQIVDFCAKWRRWYAFSTKQPDMKTGVGRWPVIKTFSPDLQKKLADSNDLLAALEATAVAELNKHRGITPRQSPPVERKEPYSKLGDSPVGTIPRRALGKLRPASQAKSDAIK